VSALIYGGLQDRDTLQQPGFVARLRAVGVHVDATTRPGRHDWRLWRSMLPTTLLWLGARFGAP